MKQLGGELKARLQAAMADGGPEAAVRVCADEAQAITAGLRAEGMRAGRASLRLRNPNNTAPAWVQQWLEVQGERKADGVVGIDTIDSGTARVLQPIAVDGICLTCHGAPQAIPPSVRTLLRERYAQDRATGYSPGDLRGAIWAEVALPKP